MNNDRYQQLYDHCKVMLHDGSVRCDQGDDTELKDLLARLGPPDAMSDSALSLLARSIRKQMNKDKYINDLTNLERFREEQHRAEDEALRQPLLCVGGPLHMQTYRFESGSMRFSYFALAGESAALP